MKTGVYNLVKRTLVYTIAAAVLASPAVCDRGCTQTFLQTADKSLQNQVARADYQHDNIKNNNIERILE